MGAKKRSVATRRSIVFDSSILPFSLKTLVAPPLTAPRAPAGRRALQERGETGRKSGRPGIRGEVERREEKVGKGCDFFFKGKSRREERSKLSLSRLTLSTRFAQQQQQQQRHLSTLSSQSSSSPPSFSSSHGALNPPLVGCCESATQAKLVATTNSRSTHARAARGEREREREEEVDFVSVSSTFSLLTSSSSSLLLLLPLVPHQLTSRRSAASRSRRSARPCSESFTTAPTSSC